MDARARTDAGSIVGMLKAAGETTRLHLLMLCRRCDLTVSDLAWITGQSQPGISRSLKQLCDVGLLERYTEGNWVIYRQALGGAGDEIGAVIDRLMDEEGEPTAGYLARLEEVLALGYHFVTGTSRKRFIGHFTGRDASDRDIGTVATSVVARMKGSAVLRVHDVAANADALAIADAVLEAAGRVRRA